MDSISINRGNQEENPTDWNKLSHLFSDAISSQSQELQLKAIIKFSSLSKQAPEPIVTPAISALINLLSTTPSPTIQQAIACSLLSLTRRIDGPFVQIVGNAGAIAVLMRLLPDSRDAHRRCLLKCLSGIVAFDNSNRVILARNGGVQFIVGAIASCTDDTRKCLLEMLTALAMVREARAGIVRHGGLGFLVEAVSDGKITSRTRAAHVIGLLGNLRRFRKMLADLGAIQELVGLLRDGDDSGRIVAGNALGIVSSHVDSIRLAVQAGAIPLYVELLRGHGAIGKEIAVDVFCVLAVAEENAVLIADHLVRILRGSDGEEAKVAALDVIWNLSGYTHSVVRDCGAIPLLIEFVTNGVSILRERGLAAIAQLSYEEKNRGTMVEDGVIPVLLELLRNGSAELWEYATETLLNFADDPLYREVVSAAFEIPSFLTIRERLIPIHASDEYMTGSMTMLSMEEHFGL